MKKQVVFDRVVYNEGFSIPGSCGGCHHCEEVSSFWRKCELHEIFVDITLYKVCKDYKYSWERDLFGWKYRDEKGRKLERAD